MPFASSPLLHRAWRGLRNAAAFGLAGVLGCALLELVAPLPDLPVFSEKFRYFQQHKDEFDTLFIGSSRVYRQVIPALFDAATQAAGKPTKSFNFGQDGAFPPESFFVLRKILTLPLPRLRWVFIELMDFKVRPLGENEGSAQALYWHDWHHTQLSVSEILSLRQPPPLRRALLWREYRLWLLRASRLGAGTPLLEPLWRHGESASTPQWLAQAGHQPGRDRGLTGAVREEYLRLLQHLQKVPPSRLRPHLEAELRSLIAAVRQSGAQPVFVVSPTVNVIENFQAVPEGATLLSLNRPQLYPELYRPEHYYDTAHLNPTGAALYTKLLVERFLQETASLPTDPARLEH